MLEPAVSNLRVSMLNLELIANNILKKVEKEEEKTLQPVSSTNSTQDSRKNPETLTLNERKK
ncbi:hypothetical protein TSAR_004495 [Trichomalopsis sarcophagae]|uniref:Uncharacterized protein n=1 Tax=Trichomalopsis sarcophagae TaxID=543379 RepID=A0A232END0_9HYME|nr:hypothetical protein TSAR_004495 [Trichomalopsis sarcophagae]